MNRKYLLATNRFVLIEIRNYPVILYFTNKAKSFFIIIFLIFCFLFFSHFYNHYTRQSKWHHPYLVTIHRSLYFNGNELVLSPLSPYHYHIVAH
jgi:hypothetical protein